VKCKHAEAIRTRLGCSYVQVITMNILRLTMHISRMVCVLWKAGTAYFSWTPEITPGFFSWVLSCSSFNNINKMWIVIYTTGVKLTEHCFYAEIVTDITTRHYPDFCGVHVAHLFGCFRWCAMFCVSSSCILCTQCCQSLWIVHSWFNGPKYWTPL
jgi:hypothetical protein